MDVNDMIQKAFSFLQKHFLHWVKTMSILGLASEVIIITNALQRIAQVSLTHIP